MSKSGRPRSRQDLYSEKQSAPDEQPKSSSSDYVLLFDQYPLPLWVVDAETLQFLEVNEAALRLYGYSRDEFLSMTAKEICPPEEIPRVLQYLQEAEKSGARDSAPWRAEVQHWKKYGDRLRVEVFWNRLQHQNRKAWLVTVVDATERKRTEEALRESETRFQAVFTSAAIGMAVADLAGHFQEVNEAYCDIVGYSREELLRMDFATITHPEDREKSLQVLRQLLTGEKENCVFDKRYVTKSGNFVWAQLSASVVRDAQGKPVNMISLTQNITERRVAEEKVQARTGQRAAVAELSQRALLETNLETLFDKAVALVAQTLRLDHVKILELLPQGRDFVLKAGVGWREGLVGQSTVPADLNSQAGYTLHSSKPVLVGDMVTHEPVIVEDIHNDPRFRGAPLLLDHRIISGMSVLIYGVDRPYGVLGAHTVQRRQFTPDEAQFLQSVANVLAVAIRRKRAEESLQVRARQQESLARIGQIALQSTDLQSLMDQTVKLVAATLGVDSSKVLELQPDGQTMLLRAGVGWRDGMVGRAIVGTGRESQAGYTLASDEPVVSENVHEENRFEVLDLLREHGVQSSMTVVIDGPPGRHYGVLGACSQQLVQFTPNDTNFLQAVAHVLAAAIQRDHVERALNEAQMHLSDYARELEGRVADRTARLEEIIQSLEGVLYHVAHDLRAPLRSMQGFTTLLLSRTEATLDAEAKDCGERIITAAHRMDLLIQDLLTYGRLSHAELPCYELDLNNHVEMVLHQLADEIQARGAEVEVTRQLPKLHANPRVLEQVLINLVSNALKFTPPDVNPRICIWAEETESHVKVWIADNGIGIAPEHQERIFRVFERLHTAEAFPGTGIGLAVVAKGMQRAGGRAGVESQPGQGSRFWLEFPKP